MNPTFSSLPNRTKAKIASAILLIFILIFSIGVMLGRAASGNIILDTTSTFDGNLHVSGTLYGALPYSNLTGIARGLTTCVNGTWIQHNLGIDPSNIILTMASSGYINKTCSYVTPTVIAHNSTHFQIGFYIRFQPIDRMNEIVPTASEWGTDPTNLENCVDDNWVTVTGTGSNTTASNILGKLTWDMGAEYGVELRSKIGLWSDTGTMAAYWAWSNDNITWYATSSQPIAQITVASEYVMFSQIEYTRARYVQQLFYHTGSASLCYVKLYECQGWDLINAVLPVDTLTAAPIFWTVIV